MSGSGNPSVPARAGNPIVPPLANIQVINPQTGIFTPAGLGLIQQMWAAIAGSGGAVDYIDFLLALSLSPPYSYSSPTDAALPYQIAALQIPADPPVPGYVPFQPSDTPLRGYTPYLPPDPVPDQQVRLRVRYSYQVPLTGFSITVPDGITNLILDPAGALATGTITMPANPLDGQICGVASSQVVTTLTMSANTGQTLDGGLATFAANGFARYQYVQSVATWFRIG